MPADPFTLRQADQVRTDFAIIEDELEAINKRLTQLPTRNEVWRADDAGNARRRGRCGDADRGIRAALSIGSDESLLDYGTADGLSIGTRLSGPS